MSFEIVSAAMLDEAKRRVAAEFARLALEIYYSSLPNALALDLIAAEFLVHGGELAEALVALDAHGKPIGLVAGYPLAELAKRQLVSLYHCLSHLPSGVTGGFVASARQLAADVPPISGDGRYLARIGLAPETRGGDLANQLLGAFLAETGDSGAVLHVHNANARAIGFYKRHGFALENSERDFWVMRRAAT